MSQPPHRTFTGDFKVFFLRGLAILLPSVLTIWIVVYAYQFVDTRIAQPINSITRMVVVRAVPVIIRTEANQPEWFKVTDDELAIARQDRLRARLSDETLRFQLRQEELRKWWSQHAWLDAIGLILAVLLFYLAGRIFGGFLGRRIAARIERVVASVPIFKQVYPYVKQLVDFMLGEKKIEFDRVVLVEYPRKGIWSIGFLTGHSMNDLATAAGYEPVQMVTVFIPSSPTPFTGYTISLPRSEIRPLSITVEEALRFTVSGGVLVPERQALAASATHPEGVFRIAGEADSGSGPAPPADRSEQSVHG